MNEDKKIAWWLQSSHNPQQFGNTVRGVALLLGTPVVIQTISWALGFTILPSDIEFIADNLANTATQLAVIIGAAWTGYGLIMKIVARINNIMTGEREHVVTIDHSK